MNTARVSASPTESGAVPSLRGVQAVLHGVDAEDVDEHERAGRRFRLEMRALAEEAEQAALERHAAERSLREALLDEANAGHLIRVEVGAEEFRGRIEGVGEDLAGLALVDGRVRWLVLDAIDAVRVGPTVGAAMTHPDHPRTLVALLRGFAALRVVVDIGRRNGPVVRGEAVAVSPTHLELLAGRGLESARVLLPLAAIAWVAEP